MLFSRENEGRPNRLAFVQMALLECISGFVTAAGTTLTGLTMATGDRNVVRPFNIPEKAYLLTFWADKQGAGTIRIKSPNIHDYLQGIRSYGIASEVVPLNLSNAPQVLTSQDTLTIEMEDSATAGDIGSFTAMLYYTGVPGLEAKLVSPQYVKDHGKSNLSVQQTLALGTAGGYSGEESLVAEYDTLHPNTEYAILGGHVSAECQMIGYRSSDFGNVRVGFPGCDGKPELTMNWFVWLSNYFNLPLIPVFNSASKNALLVDGMQDENGTDVLLTTNLVELG